MRRTLAFGLACTLVTGLAWGYWSIGSVPGGNGQAQAATVGQGATPTTSVSGSTITVSWTASTLSNGQAVNGYKIKRYSESTHVSQTILSACTGTVSALSCVESNVPSGDWVYTVTPVFSTNWLGQESQDSDPVASDSTVPVNDLSLTGVTGGAFKSGNTVYYRGTAAGSFKLSNALVDLESGPASSTTAALGGTSTGWTHSPSAVSTPAGGPYVSNVFSWAAGTSSAPTDVVTGRDGSGNTAPTTVSFVNDSTPPAGNIAYSNGDQAGRSVVVTFSASDTGGSGIASRQLQRASAPLTGGTCGTFTSFANHGPANPTSPWTDNNVTNGNCYKYQYVVTDLVGNQLVASSANVAKISYAAAVAGTAGLLSHWRLGEAAASSVSADSFTHASVTEVRNHVGETGATWTAINTGAGNGKETIGSDGRVYRAGSGLAIIHTAATPPSENYTVAADFHQKTALTGDAVGIVGRLQTGATPKFYAAGRTAAGTWTVGEASGTTLTPIAGSAASTLTVGQTYRLRFEISGTTTTTLKLFVDGVLAVTGTDTTTPLILAGKAGIADGTMGSAATKTASVGLHLDNFQVKPATYPRAADSKGSNTGDYMNDPTLGVSGAFSDNTAARFSGVNDYVQATGTTGIPTGASARSVEMWFKTTSTNKQVLFSYGSLATNQEFGLWLNAGGATMTAFGSGGGDKTFTLASAVNDGNWHQVVKTYNGTNIQLYVDGAALTAQAATRSTTMDASGFVIGAILNSASGDYGNFFTGTLDEVSLYSSVLSQATVSSHWDLRDIVIPPNSPPTGTSATLTTAEDTSRTLTTADFGYGDALEEEPHSLLAVKVSTLPTAGSLKVNDTTVTTGQYVSAADIAAGLLVFHPATNGNGTPYSSFTFQVQDNGGTINGGSDLDASPDALTFNVTAVNDTPSFTKGADQTVVGDTGAYSIPNWATGISAGPANEAGQTLTFTVTTPSDRDLFDVKPALSSTGTLSYTLKPGAWGTRTVSVKLKDNGGGGGAVDTSPTQTFVITVTQGPCTGPGSVTVTASEDAWTSQSAPTQNKGTDSALYVVSKSGSANQRSLVQFSLPSIPTGCALSNATFELSNETAAIGRTINVSRASAIWSGDTVNWSNQPAPVAGTAVGAAAGTDWMSWTVTSMVQSHYTGENTGFVVHDSVESSSTEMLQKFKSIEGGGAGHKPKLTVEWVLN